MDKLSALSTINKPLKPFFNSVLNNVSSIYANLLEQNKTFT